MSRIPTCATTSDEAFNESIRLQKYRLKNCIKRNNYPRSKKLDDRKSKYCNFEVIASHMIES